MLELNALPFLGAATTMARLHSILTNLAEDHGDESASGSAKTVNPILDKFKAEAAAIGARLAVKAVDRLSAALQAPECTLSVKDLTAAIFQIESRFADYLEDVQFFALSEHESAMMGSADTLVAMDGFSVLFPAASFEAEEAAKCIALGRHTAAVFHSMRMLEIGIKALAKRLSIPSPTKSAEKNWKFILDSIRAKVDELYPAGKRLPHSEGAAFEDLLVNLEAVRNPWRNATMHVENIYAPHEALHITRCSTFFMVKLSSLTDEAGCPSGAEQQLLEGGTRA
ncbi:hypothetical protein HMF7854_13040 [Sphingomonas ginkgonis]|uniref:Uncharacterized protein n=1 Tax=Sphingomonas ginkgonis TaxID=2315330 RepID=A0A3R9YK30_9SPHN|nr:hypothetical protein [Sphingomonas ginkgonis]RST31656.1 hypothetical protein HMF7854_13040 [Sphingomonas ginkgonis]